MSESKMTTPEAEACDDHDFTQFKEGYYGYTCPKCRMLIPYGCEPWAPESNEPDSDYCEDE